MVVNEIWVNYTRCPSVYTHTVKVAGSVRFNSPPERVYEHLARGVLGQAVETPPGESAVREGMTLLTRYETKLWFGTVVTTEEATLEPGRSITWRHVDGPLTGSVETFRIEPREGGGCVVRYRGDIVARHPLFKGPGEWFFVAPTTRRVSLGALRQARAEMEGGGEAA